MIPSFSLYVSFQSIFGRQDNQCHVNEDVAAHADEVQPRTGWRPFVRLRNWWTADAEARAHERKLIEIWETSPHLLDDIGVVLSADRDLPEHLVHAPDPVRDHIRARTGSAVMAPVLILPPERGESTEGRSKTTPRASAEFGPNAIRGQAGTAAS